MAVAFDAFSNVAAGTGNLSWTHTPVGTPRGVRVDIVENGGTNGVSGVTYGGVAMELAAVNAKTSGEAGTVITYFLGKNIPAGAQTVAVTVSDAVSKRAGATTLTAATDTCWISCDPSIASDSIVNPTSTLNLLGKSCFVSLAGHSGQGAVTGTTPLTGWTSRLEHDFGAQVAVWYTYNTISATNVACGWTQTADDAVMVAIAITEAPLATDSLKAGLTDTASVAVVFDARALPILLTDTASVSIITILSCMDSCAIAADAVLSYALALNPSDDLRVGVDETATQYTLTGTPFLPIRMTDTASITQLGVFGSDSMTVACLESSELNASVLFFNVQDDCAVLASEARPSITSDDQIILSVADECAVHGVNESIDIQVFIPGGSQNFAVSDSLSVKLNGEPTPPISRSATDAVVVGLLEPADQYYSLQCPDPVTLAITDVGGLAILEGQATFNVTDTIAVGSLETAEVVPTLSLAAVELMQLVAADDTPDVAIVIIASDAMRINAVDMSTDVAAIQITDAIAVGTLEVSRVDIITELLVADDHALQCSDVVTSIFLQITVSEGVSIGLGDLTGVTAAFSQSDAVAVSCVDATALFNTYFAIESLAVQAFDTTIPIFSNFVGKAVSDECLIAVTEAITELSVISTQLVSDACTLIQDDGITAQAMALMSGEALAIGEGDAVLTTASVVNSDSLAVLSLESLRVTVITAISATVFSDDALAIGLGEQAAIAKTEICAVEDECLVGVTDTINDYVASPGTTPERWNGSTNVEHKRDQPFPGKYYVGNRWSW